MTAAGTRALRQFMAICSVLCALCAACRTASTAGAGAGVGERQPDSQTKAKAAASAPTPPQAVESRVELLPPGQDPVSVSVEVVATNEARQRGLMYRKQLAPDAGMLFIFEREEHHSFWMHNTLIPLDIIFIKADWTILGIVENATPMTDSLRSVPGDSQYVLEVNAGYSRRHGLQPGTAVHYVPAVNGN